MDLELTDRTVLITGGSSGIGLSCVERLLREGAKVVTCARDSERLNSALEPLVQAHPGRLVWQSADVRDSEQVDAIVAAGVEAFGAIDMVVNNAGQSLVSTFETTADEQWMNELQLKFFGVIHPLRAARPQLRNSDAAAVVNINAVLARQPEPHLVATGAARAGILNLSQSLSREFADDGIRVNSICVGVIDTGQWRRRYDDAKPVVSFDEWCRQLAQKRGASIGRFGTAEEISSAVAFLLSPLSAYTTGAVLEIDGGVGRYV